ncbi:hypothetical protein DICPUDRAFT_151379 [Dictyostelium purpureum]|uniref:Transmembrane protein n=1 Tax=Dictyostelium purpureum TaxID=5786 RepID=F0ZIP3_DICPU|nr:uncharacterized protein DICPUDRAFT_151379 [Dictyostelium purpureum]EGC36220.1 hypothetical protein DICPUDRAFT_151379 [Dictyostelium purpureum]|eukprot:XP_003287287.1 hypothetical protein DICPUDRAFT_151379 [Dictyostelium purpureum]
MKLVLIILVLLIVTNNCIAIYNDDYYGDCNYINQDQNSEPLTIYILTFSNKTNNIFISSNQIKDNSTTTLLYRQNKKNFNQFEFITIASNDSILVQTVGGEPFLISDIKKESFSYRWDKPLYHPFLTYQCKNNFANITAMTLSSTSTIKNNSSNSTNNNNSVFTILSGSIFGVDEEKNFDHETNIAINPNEIPSFKSSFDRANSIIYSYIKEKDKENYYIVITDLNFKNITYNQINTGLDFTTISLSANNNTIVLSGYDQKSNTTKYYSVIINNGTASQLNSSTTDINKNSKSNLNASIKLLLEKPIKITNTIKSSNSNYLLSYSSISNNLLVFNIATMKFNIYNITIKGVHKDISDKNDDYESFLIQDMFASGGKPPITNTTLSIVNNSPAKIYHRKSLIIFVVCIGFAVLLFGFLGFYVYIRKRRNNRFKKISEIKENKYPEDNITILLKNYR